MELCFFISPFHFTMDAEPKIWNRSCEAAKQLRQDLAEGIIDPRSYKPAVVQKTRDVYLTYPRSRFSSNMRNIVTDFEVVSQLGSEKVMEWVESGKPPSRPKSKEGKSYITFYFIVA